MAKIRSLLELDRDLCRRVQEKIEELVGPSPFELQEYERPYKEHIRGARSVPVTRAEVFAAMQGAEIVYCGDYHTYRPTQETVEQILHALNGSTSALAVEHFLTMDQAHINAWLSGEMTEKTFQDHIDWEASWGFPWENYRPALMTAQKFAIPVVGLNGPGNAQRASLEERDWAMAKAIVVALEKPGTLVAQLGDLHLTPAHLTRFVEELVGRPLRQVTLFQNFDRLYWEFGDRAEAAQIYPNQYCIFHGPVFRRYLSYLEWIVTKSSYVDRDDFKVFRSQLEKQYRSFARG